MRPVENAKIHFNQENTPVSDLFDDVYFSNQNGLQESRYVFQQGNRLWRRWLCFKRPYFIIAETGFGTGLNFFAVTARFREFRAQFPAAALKRLFFISFEKYPPQLSALRKAHRAYPEFSALAEQLRREWPHPIEGCYRFHFAETTLDLWFGDVADNLPQLGDYMRNKIDAWFLDGFSPAKNPEMWNETLYRRMYRYTRPDGTFATFTAASRVRKELEASGFEVRKRKGYGKKREMLCGKKSADEAALSPAKAPWYLAQSAAGLTENADIAVIGGGIASLFTASTLLRRGAKVTLYCEDEQPALNASGNKQGAFYPQLSDDDLINIRFYIHAFAYANRQLRRAIAQGIEFEHEFCGVALTGYNERTQKKLDKIAAYQWDPSLYQALNQAQLSEVVGLPLPCGGGFIPQGGWLAPRQFVQNAFARLQKSGLILKTLQKITALRPQGSGWRIENARGENFVHEALILANGHKLNGFEQTKNLPTYAVRGQVSLIPTSENLLKLKTVLCYDGYLTPADQAKTGHCIGASHVRNCDDRRFSAEEQLHNQQKIQRNLAPMDWTKDVNTGDNLARQGVRCAVRDRIPLMGNAPDFNRQTVDYKNIFNLHRRREPIKSAVCFDNLFLVGALGSRGLTSAPLLGETLASLIYGEPLPLSEEIIHALNPNRSWMRKLLKGTAIS